MGFVGFLGFRIMGLGFRVEYGLGFRNRGEFWEYRPPLIRSFLFLREP